MSIEQIMGMASEQVKCQQAQQPRVDWPALREKPNKRRNIARWRENRLRRLDHEISRHRRKAWSDIESSPEGRRILDRASQLANQVQIDWDQAAKQKRNERR